MHLITRARSPAIATLYAGTAKLPRGTSRSTLSSPPFPFDGWLDAWRRGKLVSEASTFRDTSISSSFRTPRSLENPFFEGSIVKLDSWILEILLKNVRKYFQEGEGLINVLAFLLISDN